MRAVFRLWGICVLLCLGNAALLGWMHKAGMLVCMSVLFLLVLVVPCLPGKGVPLRLRVLRGGRELLLMGVGGMVLEGVFLAGGLAGSVWDVGWEVWVLEGIVFCALEGIMLFMGCVQIVLCSRRMGAVFRVVLLLLWWVPVVHVVLFLRAVGLVRREYYDALAYLQSEKDSVMREDCRTRYPIVLVHGIFFRDWQYFNYWGRIPSALTRCGAQVFYANQQSSLPISRAAEEIKAYIQSVLKKTGAEKVNLIAHSKGGLDCRYLLSRLDFAPYVASLTTINTPHRGCVWVQALMEKVPVHVQQWIAQKYERVFSLLGDSCADFLGGVQNLTPSFLCAFNELCPDQEGVLYQSVMSTMRSPLDAGFPLNLTWHFVKHYDQAPNDGLVCVSSAQWGTFLGCVTTKKRRGVSHGDMIDLFREDIEGFDVRGFYIRLVHELKNKGL